MKALSIRQPWAWLIVHGYKDIENRSWPTKVRGRVLVHAGKRLAGDVGEARAIAGHLGIELPEAFELGGLVGEVEITGCVKESPSRWFFGAYGFVLRNARVLPFRACAGALGFFDVVTGPSRVDAIAELPAPPPGERQMDLF